MSESLDLREANLRAGLFSGDDLTDADLRRADLQLADLTDATLRGARLNWADLTCATLVGADLRNADLSGADLSGADLTGADLRGALLDGTKLDHARVAGTQGLPTHLELANDAVKGTNVDGRLGEPAAALAAFARGRELHAAGRLALAGRAYALARAWQPNSDLVPYALACLAFDAEDAETAQAWLLEAVRVDPEADRARLELALVWLFNGEMARAQDLLAPVLHRWPALTDAPVPTARALVGETAAIAWLDRQNRPHREVDRPEPTGHAAVAQAITLGDMDGAATELGRLEQQEPLATLWRLLLPKLKTTGDAFAALLQTRDPPCGPVHTLAWRALGAHATTARLQTATGVVWAQRFAGPLRSAASLQYAGQVLNALHAHGFRVPRWLTDAAGDPLLAFDGDWLVASADLPGEPLAPSLADCAAAGELLAKLHNAAGGLAIATPRPPGGLRNGGELLAAEDPAAAWHVALATEPTLHPHLTGNPLHAHVGPLLELTARRLRPLLPLCPRGLCHGDFAPHNLLRQPDGALAVLDWDLADFGPLVGDLARALELFAVRWPMRANQPCAVDRPRLRAFFRAYCAHRPLLQTERDALPVLMAASRLDLDTCLLTLVGPLDPGVIDAVLPRLHARISHAAAGAPDLVEALRDAPPSVAVRRAD